MVLSWRNPISLACAVEAKLIDSIHPFIMRKNNMTSFFSERQLKAKKKRQ